jgi:hypothetical protein
LFPEEREIQDYLEVDGKTLTFEPQNRLQAQKKVVGHMVSLCCLLIEIF